MIEDFDKDIFKKCMPHFSKLPVIFDVGAHEGLYTKFVLEMIPDAECFLFEPNIELYHALCQYKNVFALAVSECNVYKPFYVCPKGNDELSSLYKREVFNETGFEVKTVPCTSIDSFWLGNRIYKIDFLKIDVEGGELDVLNGCKYMLSNKNIKFIQIEYGSTYKDAHVEFRHILDFSTSYGYRAYELIENKFVEVTKENFIEDFRYTVFLLTYLPCS